MIKDGEQILPDKEIVVTEGKYKKYYLVKWEVSDINYIKINFDGLTRNGDGISGFILRNYVCIMFTEGV